jgi:predicted phosphodiesterase
MGIANAYSVLGHILNGRRGSIQATPLPPTDQMIDVISEARRILKRENTILEISGEVEVVGDIHGDLDSLLAIFSRRGSPGTNKYLFLGDYVDRGSNSIEVVLILFALKIIYPSNIYLIRGNHELSFVAKKYDFMEECIDAVDMAFFKLIMKAFAQLPLAAVINKEIFACHGGIPETDLPILEYLNISRPLPKEYKDIQEGLLWSDPKQDMLFEFEFNSTRKAGNFFGRKALENFFALNGFNYLIRAHEVCQEGFDLPLGENVNCVTVFSSAGHKNGNAAATITVGIDRSISVTQFGKEEEEPNDAETFFSWVERECNDLTDVIPVEVF